MKSTRPKNVSNFFSPAVNQNRRPDQVRAQLGIPCLRLVYSCNLYDHCNTTADDLVATFKCIMFRLESTIQTNNNYCTTYVNVAQHTPRHHPAFP